jgi:hypothetical protein
MYHGADDGAQIEIYDDVVGEVPGDDNKEGPKMETMQTRGAGSEATRCPLNVASSLSTCLVRMSRLVRSWRQRVSYAAYARQSDMYWEAGKPAEYRGARESTTKAGMEESVGAESIPLLE